MGFRRYLQAADVYVCKQNVQSSVLVEGTKKNVQSHIHEKKVQSHIHEKKVQSHTHEKKVQSHIHEKKGSMLQRIREHNIFSPTCLIPHPQDELHYLAHPL